MSKIPNSACFSSPLEITTTEISTAFIELVERFHMLPPSESGASRLVKAHLKNIILSVRDGSGGRIFLDIAGPTGLPMLTRGFKQNEIISDGEIRRIVIHNVYLDASFAHLVKIVNDIDEIVITTDEIAELFYELYVEMCIPTPDPDREMPDQEDHLNGCRVRLSCDDHYYELSVDSPENYTMLDRRISVMAKPTKSMFSKIIRKHLREPSEGEIVRVINAANQLRWGTQPPTPPGPKKLSLPAFAGESMMENQKSSDARLPLSLVDNPSVVKTSKAIEDLGQQNQTEKRS